MNQAEQTQTRRKSPRLFWLVLATVAIFVSAGALTLWLPYHDRQTIIAQFEHRGGVVHTRPSGPTWLREYVETENLAFFDEVVSVDFIKSKVDDGDIDLLLKFPMIEGLTLYGPELTDTGLLSLQKLANLHTLMLVNCPKISSQALAYFQTTRPEVSVVRRGNALLGIAGETVPGGCLILTVVRGLAADKAGLRVGDIIKGLDDQPVTSYESLTDLLLTRQPGENVKLIVATPPFPGVPGFGHRGFEGPARPIEATLSGWQ